MNEEDLAFTMKVITVTLPRHRLGAPSWAKCYPSIVPMRAQRPLSLFRRGSESDVTGWKTHKWSQSGLHPGLRAVPSFTASRGGPQADERWGHRIYPPKYEPPKRALKLYALMDT